MQAITRGGAYQLRLASEARVERIGDELIREHRLLDDFDCIDAWHDRMAAACRQAARNNGLDDCQRSYLSEYVREVASPAEK